MRENWNNRISLMLAIAALLVVGAAAGVFAGPSYLVVADYYVEGDWEWATGRIIVFNADTQALVTEIDLAPDFPTGVILGPDGNLYVVVNDGADPGPAPDYVKRYQGPTGGTPWAFIDDFVTVGDNGGLGDGTGLEFGPDGNLYVADGTGFVNRYDGTTGAFIDQFVALGAGGLWCSRWPAFGPDGNLYVGDVNNHDVKRYEGPAGGTPGAFIDIFIPYMSGGLQQPWRMRFRGDDVVVTSRMNSAVKRFDATTGEYELDVVSPGQGGLQYSDDFDWGAHNMLWVVSRGTGEVLRYSATGFYLDSFGGAFDYDTPTSCIYIQGTDPPPPQPPGSVPATINYQGELTNAQGDPMPDGTYALEFKFYNAVTAGDLLWTSGQISVQADGGIVTTQIELPNIHLLDALPNSDLWMEIAVEGETLSPRIKVDSLPFALKSGI